MGSRKVLIVGIHDWHSPLQVGTHYIGRYFLKKGYQVAYISAPVTPLHRLLPDSDDLRRRRANSKQGGIWEHDGQLWHYVPSALLAPDNRPLLSSSFVFRHWQRFSFPDITECVKNAGFYEIDVLFLDTLYQPFWLGAVKSAVSAYRLADNTSGFTGYSRAAKFVEKKIMTSVDRVFAASENLVEYATEGGAKSVDHLANGIDLDRFDNTILPSEVILPSFSGPVAIYVGAFEYWFDHRTIIELAMERPDLDILLVGPIQKGDTRYAGLPNVHVVGARPADQIPGYMALADIGLIPFNTLEYPELLNDVNPLKLYEYMAAGLPVVANRWNELERLGSPAILANNRNEFIKAVSRVLKERRSGEHEIKFAGNFDWQKTLQPLGDWLDLNGL